MISTFVLFERCRFITYRFDCLKAEKEDRSSVWIVQTPQIFQYPLIYGAYTSIRQKEMTGITDDAMVAEHETGVKIRFSEGYYRNIKITKQEDLVVGEAFLRENRE